PPGKDVPPPPPPPLPRAAEDRKKKAPAKLPKGTIVFFWRNLYYIIKPPYQQEDVFKTTETPRGAIKVKGPKSAARTIQALGGQANVTFGADRGIMDAIIDRPSRRPGKAGAIRFKRDPKQRTTLRINLKKARKLARVGRI
ncbi:hypothetical protein LCGC14_0744960, partial [marine sediment metagenome]